MAGQILRGVLLQIAKEQNFVDYDIEIEPHSSGGANYTSTLFNVKLSKGNNIIHMFAKVAATGEKMRSQGPKFYETENFAYSKLLKVYERLEEEHKVPHEHRLIFPKFYGCNPNKFEETIVLENLAMNGYEAYDRFKTFEWEYAKSATSELAKLHALAFAYSEYYPEEFGKIADNLKFEWDASSDQMTTYLESVITKAIMNTKGENQDKMQKYFQSFDKDQLADYYKWSRRPVLGHGDYRPSNLMHRIRDDGTVEIKIIDLQTLQANSPIVDLMYFIFSGSDKKFRAQYYEKLLEHYYAELRAAMSRLSLEPDEVYSRADFDYELQSKLPTGLLIAVITLPIITVEMEDAPKVDEDLDLNAFSTDKLNDIYNERLNGVVDDYVKFGILK